MSQTPDTAALSPLRAAGLAPLPHGFFTRAGGVSTGLYESLNGGQGSDDDAAAVAENRARIAAHLGAGGLVTVAQVHSADAVAVAGPWAGETPRADAMASATPGIALGILTADCAPVLLADPAAGVVGAAHAGWRGALDGVLEAALDRMIGLGARRERIRAAIGPTISQAAYEVGPEFLERFLDEDPENARFFAGGDGGRARFDLPSYALSRLRGAGVEAEWTGHCTYRDPARFFSYRRATHEGAPDYGRLVAAIALPG
ncbi:peptidoglycan editing factor PgeF [Paralimibaculum aggregatum]|uniref:Purine nucleoside phosphorylase n=1 Tax=Paralimibaculum aggregatum TaxID=3036245 RepID=A0ABQ6LKA0_9RHOB|nr:peptidoglycan editing factor PgeF [Limibaculum sp. NKW23]GMG83686.1 peptidoglycan editing factor PgeF [Limibaculum sp. NKW23]